MIIVITFAPVILVVVPQLSPQGLHHSVLGEGRASILVVRSVTTRCHLTFDSGVAAENWESVARWCYFHFHVGLYGNEGLLPARWQLRYSGKPLGEQLLSSPTLLWLGPRLGLDTHTAMELLCLAGAALSLTATLLEAFRDSLVFFCLWVLYLSLYQVSLHLSVSHDSLGFPSLTGWLSFQVGQVFLYFQWWVFGIKLLLRLALHSPKNVISCCSLSGTTFFWRQASSVSSLLPWH